MKNYASEVYDVSDLQKILNIGRKQAYQLVNSNSFHTIKVGSRIKIPKAIFHAWLNGQQVATRTIQLNTLN
ncbi:helix-turn-helix domain-containing protein [Solibacillus ferritrahens]|uniref:helix-turn-helix domain-containing protein n=1 Tax=Solibacillus ferritrahens TaxID=3098620 RepID=UPI00300B821C